MGSVPIAVASITIAKELIFCNAIANATLSVKDPYGPFTPVIYKVITIRFTNELCTHFFAITIVIPIPQVGFNVRYWLHCQSFLFELKSF